MSFEQALKVVIMPFVQVTHLLKSRCQSTFHFVLCPLTPATLGSSKDWTRWLGCFRRSSACTSSRSSRSTAPSFCARRPLGASGSGGVWAPKLFSVPTCGNRWLCRFCVCVFVGGRGTPNWLWLSKPMVITILGSVHHPC